MKATRCAALLAAGLLVSGSASCQVNSGGGVSGSGGGFSASATGAAAWAGLAGMFAAGAVYCMVETEDCFPDWEALEAARAARAKADADFLAGLHGFMAGDPAGIDLICAAARQGDPRAQQFYGALLLRQSPDRGDEAVSWLRRAAAQGNDHADILLRRTALQVHGAGPENVQDRVEPPAIGPCDPPDDLRPDS